MIESEHIHSAFDDDLESIEAQIMAIGGHVEGAIRRSRKALHGRDDDLAVKVVAGDTLIDKLDEQLNNATVGIIALWQPQAQDLRTVVAIMKISTSLERVGDLAKNIAKRTSAIVHLPPLEPAGGSVKRLSKAVQSQIKGSLDAFIQRDADKAREVILRDEEIDQMYNSLFREYLTHMMEDPRYITSAMHYLFIAKNLERIGDHATSVAEQTVYMVTGNLPDEDRPKNDQAAYASIELE